MTTSSRNRRIDSKVREQITKRDGGKCRKCKRPSTISSLNVHHIQAVQDGGSNEEANLITLCSACHKEWHVVEMSSELGFYIWLQYPPVHRLIAALHSAHDSREASQVSLERFVDVITQDGLNPFPVSDPESL